MQLFLLALEIVLIPQLQYLLLFAISDRITAQRQATRFDRIENLARHHVIVLTQARELAFEFYILMIKIAQNHHQRSRTRHPA